MNCRFKEGLTTGKKKKRINLSLPLCLVSSIWEGEPGGHKRRPCVWMTHTCVTHTRGRVQEQRWKLIRTFRVVAVKAAVPSFCLNQQHRCQERGPSCGQILSITTLPVTSFTSGPCVFNCCLHFTPLFTVDLLRCSCCNPSPPIALQGPNVSKIEILKPLRPNFRSSPKGLWGSNHWGRMSQVSAY